MLAKANQDLVIMHSLPIVDEILIKLNSNPRAAYYWQMEHGMYVHNPILATLIK